MRNDNPFDEIELSEDEEDEAIDLFVEITEVLHGHGLHIIHQALMIALDSLEILEKELRQEDNTYGLNGVEKHE